jgi:hypothetical protein
LGGGVEVRAIKNFLIGLLFVCNFLQTVYFNKKGIRSEKMARESMYQDMIRYLAPTYNARHIEAWIRSENGNLDYLTPAQWGREVRTAAECVDFVSAELSENLARSFGL